MSTKSDYKYPKKKHLIKDVILPIYEDYKNEKKLLGYAKLNYKVPSVLKEYPYVRAEIGSNKNKAPACIIWSFNRWNITYVDPWEYDKNISKEKRFKYISQRGFTTDWNIAYFITIQTIYPSFYNKQHVNEE